MRPLNPREDSRPQGGYSLALPCLQRQVEGHMWVEGGRWQAWGPPGQQKTVGSPSVEAQAGHGGGKKGVRGLEERAGEGWGGDRGRDWAAGRWVVAGGDLGVNIALSPL